MLHIPPTNLLLLTAKKESYKKAYPLTKNIEEFSGKSLEGPAGRKRSDRKGNKTRQKDKRGDSKVESNDSPEIPDRGGDIRHPRHPFGDTSTSPDLNISLVLSATSHSQA